MKRSIQSRLLTLAGAGVFVAAAALAIVGRSALGSLDHELQQERDRAATILAAGIADALEHDLRLLATAAAAPRVDLSDSDEGPEMAAADLALHHAQLFAPVFFVAADGRVGAVAPAAERMSIASPAVLIAVTASIQSGRPVVTDAVRAAQPGVQLVGIVPFRSSGGEPAGAIAGAINPSGRPLTALLRREAMGEHLHVQVIDGDGKTIAGSDEEAGGARRSRAAVPGTRWTVVVNSRGVGPAAISTFGRRWLWLAPSLVVLATLLGWGVARSIRRPLAELTRAAERISAGDLERPLRTASLSSAGDEIGRLAAALERMRSSLKESIDHIESANQDLERRVEERTRDLAAVNRRLADREALRKQLLRRVISAQEDERKRIARELHDDTSQALAALGMGVDAALATCSSPATAEKLTGVRQLAQRMNDELRRLIVNLRPSVLDDIGLAAAIRWLGSQLAASGVAVRCELSGLDRRLPPEVETALFRAVQEALANVARHAGADSVLIQGTFEDGRVRIEIEDDGEGFDPATAIDGVTSLRGVGLLGMRERIEILGGELTIDSGPGAGTCILMSVPVDDEPTLSTAGQTYGKSSNPDR